MVTEDDGHQAATKTRRRRVNNAGGASGVRNNRQIERKNQENGAEISKEKKES